VCEKDVGPKRHVLGRVAGHDERGDDESREGRLQGNRQQSFFLYLRIVPLISALTAPMHTGTQRRKALFNPERNRSYRF
jgi:hypothetical protein